MSDRPKIVSLQQKKDKDNTVPDKKVYKIYWEEGFVEEALADFIDPSYEGLILFANYTSDESIQITKVVNLDKMFKIEIGE